MKNTHYHYKLKLTQTPSQKRKYKVKQNITKWLWYHSYNNMLCFSKSLPSPDVSILGSSTSISQQSSKQVTIRMDLHIESNLSVCEEENETSV